MSQTFLQIGSGPGIGLATAERFAREGYRVVVASRNTARLRGHAEAAGIGDIAFDTVDAADPHAVAALVERHRDHLSVLHYNAGVLHYGTDGALQTRTLADETTGSLISDMHVNLTSALVAMRAAADAIARNDGGSILITGGGLGMHPSPQFLTLSTGKAGLRAAALSLFEPMQARGIHIAAVTVSTLVGPDSVHARAVADAFWQLHAEAPDAWTPEIVYG
ncbi:MULTISPECIES: SDR family NAD(P)-dependent oxidoreductase [unclassified Cupriavidus]|jgi:NAD(P)-dependent dehydrogenase (short-subunit alcohol dehydrogenase family)|uniref:SDR family NAD(P)-dependent oxidoreductase n=1 Tax=unclassified Cupriavidus TaxID=2640874 RepID=UPI00313C1D04